MLDRMLKYFTGKLNRAQQGRVGERFYWAWLELTQILHKQAQQDGTAGIGRAVGAERFGGAKRGWALELKKLNRGSDFL